jgi:uncharacterized damage-inducible protein DinB
MQPRDVSGLWVKNFLQEKAVEASKQKKKRERRKKNLNWVEKRITGFVLQTSRVLYIGH